MSNMTTTGKLVSNGHLHLHVISCLLMQITSDLLPNFLLPQIMANLLFKFLFIPIIFAVATGVAAQPQPATNITSGSMLYPDRHPTSWLSPSGLFAFGFYQQGGGFQVGIWLQGTPQRTVVWTADRDAPPVPSDSYLQFATGKLILWTKGSRKEIADPPETATPTARMLDSGNFVIYDKTGVIWQSFDRATLDPDGILRLYSHRFGGTDNSTVIEWSAKQNQCQVKGFCGVNSYCTAIEGGEGDCSCFQGFQYFNPKVKYQGCYRGFIYEELCRKEDPNLSYNVTVIKNLTLGGYPFSSISMVERDCQKSCQEDCTCWAAQYVDGTISGETGDKDGTRKRIILILSVVLGFLAFLFSLIAIFSFVFYRNRAIQYQKLSEKANLGLNEEFTLRSFSYSELDRATDGFKEELRHSNFGKVYKGKISEGDKTVAVKRLEKGGDEGENEFRAEITAIGQTYHRNLVMLLGFCLEGSRKLLVYEFMSNGTLADIIFNTTMRPFWKQRVKLARDIARGICYLHEECETCIIHCNIRPQNILVDDSWTAKISEFGLAKLLTQSET